MFTVGRPTSRKRASPGRRRRRVRSLDHDYFIFMPNPRGSFGQGEVFTRGNIMDFAVAICGTSWRALTRWRRLRPSTTSGSPSSATYGGMMVSWAITQTNRFKAAGLDRPFPLVQPEHGRRQQVAGSLLPRDAPRTCGRLRSISPIRFITRVKTPTSSTTEN